MIVATGSKPILMEIPGADKDKVTVATDLLLGNRQAGKSLVVIGGGLVGCETALWLAKQDKRVTIVEVLAELMSTGDPVPIMNKTMLIDLLKFHEVNVLTNTTVLEITDSGVVLKDESGSKSTLDADTVVIALGLKPDQELYHSLAGNFPDLYLIGDAKEAANIMHAVWDAYEIGRSL